ncbi:polysaccharide pyruvyl transferase family protein [Microbacterium sp. SSW1-49]|uniref:Polysaccharide pyruvyl transferase family protein n=1 Tax=Microbacterium croceum TaxID=2851645 RepID=A0ABT0FHK8_9MICO|nr:polysaccharide pyruvyl transferase family protein [Microbacterium croceum]MCK2037530.1 polysaccharide pyruvyl transferase family protein [Microbacterium croceum]
MNDDSRRIVFLGTHGQRNIGDELLLETFLTQLGDQHHYIVNSYDPDFTRSQLQGRFDVDVIDTARDRRRLLRELLRCDLLCFGGGSIIKELYASTGRNAYSTMLMILAIVTFTRRIARRPIAMLNVGVGPIRSPRGLRIARMILSQVDELTVRDALSVATCRSVGIEPRLATDAVFSADAEWLLGANDPRRPASGGSDGADGSDESTTRSSTPASPRTPVRVALNLNYDIENADNWEPFLSQLGLVLERVHAAHPLELHALPMQKGFKQHDDVEVLEGFAARVPSLRFIPHDLAAHLDAARVIESCDLLISERLHAIVIASIIGRPSFVLAYDVKVRELATTLELTPWSVDINEPFDVTAVSDRIIGVIDQRVVLGAQVAQRSAELREDARANFARARQWVARTRRRSRPAGAVARTEPDE